MKIYNYSKIYNAYLRQGKATRHKDKNSSDGSSDTPRSGKASKKGKIALSPSAIEMRELAERVRVYPEVRHEKIEAGKKQIQTDKYAVNSRLVAKSMIDLLG
jgi:flagellar biosynthesis anti-sigma factor FlgM